MAPEQKKQEKPKEDENAALIERLAEGDRINAAQAEELKKLRGVAALIKTPIQQAEDGRPWEFDPRPRPVGTGANQKFVEIKCKGFVPMTNMPNCCERDRVCKNARRVGGLECKGGLDGHI